MPSGRHPKQIPLERLREVYHLPLHEAAQYFGICPSVLKKICRGHNIAQWPYRQLHAIEQNLISLNESIPSLVGIQRKDLEKRRILLQKRWRWIMNEAHSGVDIATASTEETASSRSSNNSGVSSPETPNGFESNVSQGTSNVIVGTRPSELPSHRAKVGSAEECHFRLPSSSTASLDEFSDRNCAVQPLPNAFRGKKRSHDAYSNDFFGCPSTSSSSECCQRNPRTLVHGKGSSSAANSSANLQQRGVMRLVQNLHNSDRNHKCDDVGNASHPQAVCDAKETMTSPYSNKKNSIKLLLN